MEGEGRKRQAEQDRGGGGGHDVTALDAAHDDRELGHEDPGRRQPAEQQDARPKGAAGYGCRAEPSTEARQSARPVLLDDLPGGQEERRLGQ